MLLRGVPDLSRLIFSCVFRVGDHDQADSEVKCFPQQPRLTELGPGLREAARLGRKITRPGFLVFWMQGRCSSVEN